MNGKLAAGLAVLGTLGSAALVLAVLLGLGGLNASNDANTARRDVAKVNVGFTKWVNDMNGNSEFVDEKIKERETFGAQLIGGAVLVGMMGAGILAVIFILVLVGGNKKNRLRPAQQPMSRNAP